MTRDGRRVGRWLRRTGTEDSPGAGPAGPGPDEVAGPVLRAAGLTRTYGADESLVWAVDEVDLDVPAGQTLAVTGPSGCGKSTLLQLLGGLDRPTEGEVWLGGRRSDRLGERALARLRRRAVGFVFQSYHLMPELSAAQNVELPALLAGASPRTARIRAAELLDQVGLADRTTTVHALSDPAHGLTHHRRLNTVTAYLPTSLLLGIRLLTGRPGRAALASAGTAATTLMITALLTFHAELDAAPASLRYGPLQVRTDQTGQVLLAVTLALVALSTLNTVLLGWSTAVQARHTLTITRTLGATPGQVVAALCTAQLLPAVPAVAAGIPAGLGLYWLFGTQAAPPGSWLLTAALVILSAAGALTALPAWTHTRGPAGRTLDTEPV
ncbi:ATP-binding cassette domain-containing protein [Streptomyces sp. NPDC005820]|uniref:ABC transporter ATP-binding protein/permease n=1 Tax=Streptomyces sp. NPDC005820 TaxID=3157069 RepID=UPI0033F82FC2